MIDIGNIISVVFGGGIVAAAIGIAWKIADGFIFDLILKYFPKTFEKITLLVFKKLNDKIEEYKKNAPKSGKLLEKKLIDLTNKIEEILKT